MKLIPAAIVAIALLAVAAPAASAATMTPSPVKDCYRDQETVNLLGSGFTPNSVVSVARDSSPIGTLTTDPTGVFNGSLQLAQGSGQQARTYVASDSANTTITASANLLVSALSVNVRPTNGRPGKLLRIGARGFTTGKTLYAHIRKGSRLIRNLRIGRLKGDCRKLSTRKRLFSSGTPIGSYSVRFDTNRRYKGSAKVKVDFTVNITRVVRPSSAGASAVAGGWTLVR